MWGLPRLLPLVMPRLPECGKRPKSCSCSLPCHHAWKTALPGQKQHLRSTLPQAMSPGDRLPSQCQLRTHCTNSELIKKQHPEMYLFGKVPICHLPPPCLLSQTHTPTLTEVFREPLHSQGPEGPDLFLTELCPRPAGHWPESQGPGSCLQRHTRG